MRIPYLFFEINWADYYGFVSKHKEETAITTHATAGTDARTRARTHARTPNKKDKLNGRKIRTTFLYRTVRYRSVREIPFGIDKTDGSQTRKSN